MYFTDTHFFLRLFSNDVPMGRQSDLDSLYKLFKRLREELDEFKRLGDTDLGPGHFPDSGLYVFFEAGERRANGDFPRVTRVGASSRNLWDRLREHRGSTRGKYAGGGTTAHHRFGRK